MIITRECDYAIRILRILSRQKIVSVHDMSELENIPLSFTYKICRKLTKSSIIKSHRGTSGGYELNKNIDEITIYDVCKAIDVNIFVADCVESGYTCTQNTSKSPCLVHNEFCRIQHIISNELRIKKISELL